MRRYPLLLLLAVIIPVLPLLAQQSYVSRYDVFTGYTYLNSPKVSLPEHGFHLQAGIRPKTWYSLGFDFSTATGSLMLKPDLLPTALQQSLAAQLGQLAAIGRLPAGYKLLVPADSSTQTYTMGPQLACRKWQPITLFLRPSLGAIHENATPQPTDAIAAGVVKNLAPS